MDQAEQRLITGSSDRSLQMWDIGAFAVADRGSTTTLSAEKQAPALRMGSIERLSKGRVLNLEYNMGGSMLLCQVLGKEQMFVHSLSIDMLA